MHDDSSATRKTDLAQQHSEDNGNILVEEDNESMCCRLLCCSSGMEYIQVMKEVEVTVWFCLCSRVKSEMYSWSKNTLTLEAKMLKRNTQNLACWIRYWMQHVWSTWQMGCLDDSVCFCVWSITFVPTLSLKDLGNIGPSYDTQKQTTTAPASGGLNGEIMKVSLVSNGRCADFNVCF